MKSEWGLPARYFILALIIAFLIYFGYQIRELFRPLILAGVIAYVFYPLVALTQRRFKLNRKTASNIVFFVSLALMILLPIVLVPILVKQTSEIGQDIQQTLSQAQQYFAVPIYIGGIPIDLAGMIAQYRNSLTSPLSLISQNPVSLIRNTSRSTLWVLIIFGSTYFFMTEWEDVREGLVRIAPEAYRPDIRKLYTQIRQVWMAYLRGQLTLMIIVAVTFIIVWTAIGLPGSLYLGLLAGLFSIVPDVGPDCGYSAGIGSGIAGRFLLDAGQQLYIRLDRGRSVYCVDQHRAYLAATLHSRTQCPYQRSGCLCRDHCGSNFLRDFGRVYYCAGIGFPGCDLELSSCANAGLAAFSG